MADNTTPRNPDVQTQTQNGIPTPDSPMNVFKDPSALIPKVETLKQPITPTDTGYNLLSNEGKKQQEQLAQQIADQQNFVKNTAKTAQKQDGVANAEIQTQEFNKKNAQYEIVENMNKRMVEAGQKYSKVIDENIQANTDQATAQMALVAERLRLEAEQQQYKQQIANQGIAEQQSAFNAYDTAQNNAIARYGQLENEEQTAYSQLKQQREAYKNDYAEAIKRGVDEANRLSGMGVSSITAHQVAQLYAHTFAQYDAQTYNIGKSSREFRQSLINSQAQLQQSLYTTTSQFSAKKMELLAQAKEAEAQLGYINRNSSAIIAERKASIKKALATEITKLEKDYFDSVSTQAQEAQKSLERQILLEEAKKTDAQNRLYSAMQSGAYQGMSYEQKKVFADAIGTTVRSLDNSIIGSIRTNILEKMQTAGVVGNMTPDRLTRLNQIILELTQQGYPASVIYDMALKEFGLNSNFSADGGKNLTKQQVDAFMAQYPKDKYDYRVEQDGKTGLYKISGLKAKQSTDDIFGSNNSTTDGAGGSIQTGFDAQTPSSGGYSGGVNFG